MTGFTLGFPARYAPDHFDHRIAAFNFIRGVITGLLVPDGWAIEAYSEDWIHWIKNDQKIVMRGIGSLGTDLAVWAEDQGTPQDELRKLAERVSTTLDLSFSELR